MALANTLPKTPKTPTFSYPWYSPRFWHGMKLGDWLRLVGRNRCRIHPARMPMAAAVTAFATGNSVLARIQEAYYGRRIAAVELTRPPVFIIGHWRSGTTMLHELLSLDTQFTTPTTYQCFAPNHFLLTEWMFERYLGFLIPSKRPMDNVEVGWKSPQEDEFALCNMGCCSPYLRIAFPNEADVFMQYLDMESLSEEELSQWRETLLRFVRTLTLQQGKRLVLKSPPHTGRIEVLSKMFPGARFIHLTRNPAALFPSTVRLWQSLDAIQGLQLAKGKHLREYVFESLRRMYHGFESQRSQIDPSHILDIRYEDLAADPLGQLEGVYDQLKIGDFETVRPQIEKYVERKRDYRPNRHELDAETKAEIAEKWGDYIRRYGYEQEFDM